MAAMFKVVHGDNAYCTYHPVKGCEVLARMMIGQKMAGGIVRDVIAGKSASLRETIAPPDVWQKPKATKRGENVCDVAKRHKSVVPFDLPAPVRPERVKRAGVSRTSHAAVMHGETAYVAPQEARTATAIKWQEQQLQAQGRPVVALLIEPGSWFPRPPKRACLVETKNEPATRSLNEWEAGVSKMVDEVTKYWRERKRTHLVGAWTKFSLELQAQTKFSSSSHGEDRN